MRRRGQAARYHARRKASVRTPGPAALCDKFVGALAGYTAVIALCRHAAKQKPAGGVGRCRLQAKR